MTRVSPSQSLTQRSLNRLELLGNKLPHPTLLFIYFCIAVVAISALASVLSVTATHPINGDVINAKSLLSAAGFHWLIDSAVRNFVNFAPVGSVIVAIMGIAVAEHSGLLASTLGMLAKKAPPRLLSAIIVFAGVLSSIGFDSGYVVLIPLAGLIYRAAGRSPLAGIAAAFAGVSGGYSANLLIGPVDAILAGISSEAIALVASDRQVLSSANYYFILVSTGFITLIGSWVSEVIVEPRLSKPTDSAEENTLEPSHDTTPLRRVALFSLIYWAGLFAITFPAGALLHNPDPNGLVALPLLKSIVLWISLYAAITGAIFGFGSGRYSAGKDVIEGMESGIASLATYLVLMFFAAQFVNGFAWSGLGAITAINGAQWLAGLALSKSSLLLGFIFISALINLLIGSASAKWALLAPIFLPMLYLLGVEPEAAQMAYRIGDSSTNIITPLMPYFGVVVAFVQRHDPKAGMGTLMSLMLPYSLVFLIGWSLLLTLWMAAGLPLGPA